MRCLRDSRGETAIEYSLIASLVVLAIIAALTQYSGATNRLYNKITNAMQTMP
ncbi:MAG: Flp family type IVb pilin [Methylobacterium sp.]